MTDDKLYTSLSANTIMAKLTKLTNTIHLALKMTSAQVVETSVTNYSSFRTTLTRTITTVRTTDTPGFKPFTMIENSERFTSDRIIMQKGVQDKDFRLVSIHGRLEAVSGKVPKTATLETPNIPCCRLLSTAKHT